MGSFQENFTVMGAGGGLDCLPNLALLTAPLPDDDGDDEVEEDKSSKEKKKKYQPWTHGALLPLRIILRDFAARGLPEAGAEATVARRPRSQEPARRLRKPDPHARGHGGR